MKEVYLNTYNALVNYLNHNNNFESKNKELKSLSVEAHNTSQLLPIDSSLSNFKEEIAVYKDYAFCFISNDSHKILFNYIPLKTLGISKDTEYINKQVAKKIHFVPVSSMLGNIALVDSKEGFINYNVINVHEAFKNYARVNYCKTDLVTQNDLFKNFKIALQSSYPPSSETSKFGYTAKRPNSKHIFNYIFFNNTIVITNYSKA
ncbi:hypothetical protein [Clostridium ganghwense]|uniref:Uncharacterized protein n=1 Tax=Clostridium ganghwense TaxID=312089 RepID=A0ABT4CJ80_9CLOT|nr:hypothetical protein [Clostridium ganghwense]MCY6369102.1 hypothetical protein [Clostridium ganghwense]